MSTLARLAGDFKVGDVISLGPHWSVPAELVGKFFRVESAGEDFIVVLSLPYEDAECTRRYYSEAAQATSPSYREYVAQMRADHGEQ